MNTALPYPDEPDEKPLSQAEVLRGLLAGIARVKKRQKQPVPPDVRQALRRLGTSAEREIDRLNEYQRERARRYRYYEENS